MHARVWSYSTPLLWCAAGVTAEDDETRKDSTRCRLQQKDEQCIGKDKGSV